MSIKLGDCFIGNFPETQGFGANPDYYKQFGLSGHEGVDFGCPVGTPIIASTDGVVVKDIDDPVAGKNYGIYVALWDPIQMCVTYYCHLSSNVVNVGQHVIKGQLIGHSGATGNVTGPHLHFNLGRTDTNGVRTNTANGFSGFINPDDRRIAEWIITNPSTPLQPPQVTVPVNEDIQNATKALQNAFSALPDGDPLKPGNLEGYARSITEEHLVFAIREAKATILDGLIAKWTQEWHLTKPDGSATTLADVEREMGLLMPLEDKYKHLHDGFQTIAGGEYVDDDALIKAVQAVKDNTGTLQKQLEKCQERLQALEDDALNTFSLFGYLLKIYKLPVSTEKK